MKFISRIIKRMEIMSKYGHHSLLSDLTNTERRELGQFCLDYCKMNVGYKRHKGLPKFSIVKGKVEGTFGEYCDKKISIYYNECVSVGKFVNTFIHEYTHHLQDLRGYNKVLSRVGYENHPLEIEANEVADKYKQDCLEQFRKLKLND